jgi:hypothetical protein
MTSGAGAGFFTRVFDWNAGIERSIADADAWLHFDGFPFRANLWMRQESNARHV